MATKSRILVIDDEQEVQELLTMILRIHGYEPALAKNGLEGVELAKSFNPDLILLDVLMPKIDGFRVQELLKQDPRTSGVPILFVTAKAEVDSAKRAISGGAQGFIEKPFDVDILLQKIRDLLQR